MDRLDKRLVEMGLASTRSQAQGLIKEGVVLVSGAICTKPSQKVSDEEIAITKEEIFVSRGAHKVEGALKDFDIDVKDMLVADVGASTGGFTNYVLSRGAKKVYAIDVGHDQLAISLRNDERVVNMEGVNIRKLDGLDELCDLAVVDLSFISLKLCLVSIFKTIHEKGKVVALIKPQFEVGKENLGKNGIVKDISIIKSMLDSLLNWCLEQGFYVHDFCLSPIKGKTGNQEFFFLLDRDKNKEVISIKDIEKKLEGI